MLGGNFIYGLPCLSLDFECDCFAWLYYSRFFFAWEEGGGGERTPEPRISSPPAEAEPDSIPGSGCEVQGGRARVAARELDLKCEVEWVHGSWMSRQRCAGRRGGKAEFPCGLMGRGWAEALRCRLGVCRIVVEFLDGFCVIFSLVHGMVGISYKIFCLYGHSWSFGF